jgi:hypothetical protein
MDTFMMGRIGGGCKQAEDLNKITPGGSMCLNCEEEFLRMHC